MKIALLTIWHERNFGAELQAYATIKVLQQLGYEVEMIDIRLSDLPRLNWKGRLAETVTQMGPGYRKFSLFWKKNIPVTKRYRSLKAIKSNPPRADVYLVGSDQVWNPEITLNYSTLFFLDFGDDKVKRVSYASSFGTDKWTFVQLESEVKTLLERFDKVTCREESGVRILKEEFGVNADLVLDPTLLLEDYKELVGEVNDRETLVYYPLAADPELEKYSLALAEELNLKAVNNNYCTKLFGKIEWDRPDISDWIKNIAEAKFVITRSFHGMVFAILHKRQFAALADNNGRGTRLVSLLTQLGLETRFYKSLDELNNDRPWMREIDYSKITPLLEQIRNDSIKRMKQGLEK